MALTRLVGVISRREMQEFRNILVLFNSEKILDFGTVVFSFLFDKHCPIIN